MSNEVTQRISDFGHGLGVKGLFSLKYAFVNKKDNTVLTDFITFTEFDSLTLEECSGFALPLLLFKFTCISEEPLRYINQGNVLRIYVSARGNLESDSEVEDWKGVLQDFNMAKYNIVTDGNVKQVSIYCVLDAIGYVNILRTKIYKEKNSKEVFKEIAGRYFELDFPEETGENGETLNVIGEDVPDDKQNWIQVEDDCTYLKELFEFSNYYDSFPVVGITTNNEGKGKFKYRNFINHVKNPYKYKFVPYGIGLTKEEESNKVTQIIHNGDVEDVSLSGVLSLWRSSGTIVPVYDIDVGGQPIPYGSKILPGMLSGMKYSNISSSMTPTTLPVEYSSSNLYPSAYGAKIRNVTGVALYSSQMIKFSFSSIYSPVEILDIVLVLDDTSMPSVSGGINSERDVPDSDIQSDKYPSDTHKLSDMISGLYIVTRIRRVFTKGSVRTEIEACREAHPNIIGDFIEYDEEIEEK